MLPFDLNPRHVKNVEMMLHCQMQEDAPICFKPQACEECEDDAIPARCKMMLPFASNLRHVKNVKMMLYLPDAR